MPFLLEEYNPCPPAAEDFAGAAPGNGSALIALDIQCKYQFLDEEGRVYHEYPFPGDRDLHNLGGYVGKVVKYRDPALFDYLRRAGVSPGSFATPAFPILATRSPQLDLLLLGLIRHLRSAHHLDRVRLFDHGCTVAEHFDLLDVMLRASSGGSESAADLLDYCGLDKSPMLLAVARLLHYGLDPTHFRLVCGEGSQFDLPPDSFDLSLSVGVVNHVGDALAALEKLVRISRFACVLALWATAEPDGFWAINHTGSPSYFFRRKDLARVKALRPGVRIFVADYISEGRTSQPGSYVGLTPDRVERTGCYHLVFTTLADFPFDLPELEL
jgi:hypothetical protein